MNCTKDEKVMKVKVLYLKACLYGAIKIDILEDDIPFYKLGGIISMIQNLTAGTENICRCLILLKSSGVLAAPQRMRVWGREEKTLIISNIDDVK